MYRLFNDCLFGNFLEAFSYICTLFSQSHVLMHSCELSPTSLHGNTAKVEFWRVVAMATTGIKLLPEFRNNGHFCSMSTFEKGDNSVRSNDPNRETKVRRGVLRQVTILDLDHRLYVKLVRNFRWNV